MVDLTLPPRSDPTYMTRYQRIRRKMKREEEKKRAALHAYINHVAKVIKVPIYKILAILKEPYAFPYSHYPPLLPKKYRNGSELIGFFELGVWIGSYMKTEIFNAPFIPSMLKYGVPFFSSNPDKDDAEFTLSHLGAKHNFPNDDAPELQYFKRNGYRVWKTRRSVRLPRDAQWCDIQWKDLRPGRNEREARLIILVSPQKVLGLVDYLKEQVKQRYDVVISPKIVIPLKLKIWKQ